MQIAGWSASRVKKQAKKHKLCSGSRLLSSEYQRNFLRAESRPFMGMLVEIKMLLHLDSPEEGNRSGIVDDPLPKNQGI